MTNVGINSTNPKALADLIGLTIHGRAGLYSRLLTAREALRNRQQRMAQNRRARYRPDAEWDLGPMFSKAMSDSFRRHEIKSYQNTRTYSLAMCLKLRRDIAAARRALAEWDREIEAEVSAVEDRFLQAAE